MNTSTQPPVSNRFDGRVAIITGASSGIGLAIAERMGSEGARLLLLAAPNDAADLDAALDHLRSSGIDVHGFAADIAANETATRAVGAALSHFGDLHIVINNAGHGYYEDIFDTPLDHLDRVYAVCVRGSFALSVEAARHMRTAGYGAIVNTASTASVIGEEFQVTYNTAKGAVAAMTRSLAVDLAPYGIRVNAVAPGWTATRAAKTFLDAAPEVWAKYRTKILMDRPGSPDEIAAVHAFLASDDSAYMTGQVVFCDGGVTAGNRYSNWAAVVPPEKGLRITIPEIPKNLNRPLD